LYVAIALLVPVADGLVLGNGTVSVIVVFDIELVFSTPIPDPDTEADAVTVGHLPSPPSMGWICSTISSHASLTLAVKTLKLASLASKGQAKNVALLFHVSVVVLSTPLPAAMPNAQP